MPRRRKTNQAASGPKPNVQLKLPQGYTPKNNQAKNGQQAKHGQQKKKVSEDMNQTSPSNSKVVLPWKLNKNYPQPVKQYHFDYERTWRSLSGKDVEQEMLKQFERFEVSQLRRPGDDWTPEQRKETHDQYWKAGKPELYRTRLTVMEKNKGSPKLFIANPMVDASTMNLDNNNATLIKVLAVVELGKMILDHVKPSIRDLTALAASCKSAAACVTQACEFWDFTKGEFSTDEFVDKRDERGRLVQGGGVRSDILVISPISDRPEAFGNPYTADFTNLISLFGAFTEVPATFRSIVLDQIPFLDVPLFELMVNTMPNLESVTITRCVMLNVTMLKPLLDTIKRHPRRSTSTNAIMDKGKGKVADAIFRNQNGQWDDTPAQVKPKKVEYIKLDFFPVFFHGPTSFERLGSYGITYNEPTFHTPKAVFCLIIRCWSLANQVGMDLLSDGSSFWSFVRQLPGPDALWALKAREALLTLEYDLDPKRLNVDGKTFSGAQMKFASDLAAALTGDNQPQLKAPDGMSRYMSSAQLPTRENLMNSLKCNNCDVPTNYIKALFPLREGTCWGCKMTLYVNEMEDSHLRLWQESAVRNWCRGLDSHRHDLHALLRTGEDSLRAALDDVAGADWIWRYYLNLPAKTKPQPVKQQATQPVKREPAQPATRPVISEPAQKATQPVKRGQAKAKASSSGVLSARGNGPKIPQTSSYASAASKGLPTPAHTPKANLLPANAWQPSEPDSWQPPEPEPWVVEQGPWVSEPNAEDCDTEGAPEWFAPPPPRGFDAFRAGMARWRWSHSPATEPFDYRKGGPQRVDPCRSPVLPSEWVDKDFGGEDMRNFNRRWEWTSTSDEIFLDALGWNRPRNAQRVLESARRDEYMRGRIRDIERQAQNKADRDVHRWHHPKVEDSIISLGTPGQMPFNLDHPIPDPHLHAQKYKAALDKYEFQRSKYCHSRSGW
ncbi:hypothetical protein N658DRAFT_507701 [Parathielavia hyrcaniae]|uniref:Uncharacterized protein n=1 Tax=Parathielavia hyrcaniae TaxID=113614 RepID=A0AAN6T1E1_9PEZI|nr:hypothetical protein N658DRAFT_507701 [Parathielavia hyrcaniae]